MHPSVQPRSAWTSTAAVAALAAAVASVGIVGADLPWLVPLGAQLAVGHLPSSIHAASADSRGWHDVLAGAQLVVWAAYHHLGGERGLIALQVFASTAAFGALAHGLRREASDGAALGACLIVLVGAASAVLVARVALFSLALFPLLLLLLHEDARSPSRRIWLAVPLIALWANLHGLALAGICLLGAYLLLARTRREPLLAAGVLAGSLLALLATPALWRTPLYYRGVFENEAAARGIGLWAPLGLGLFDVLYLAALAALLACSRARLRAWEWIALIGFAAGSVHTARLGLFALFVAAYPAARELRVRTPPPVVLGSAACALAAAAVAFLLTSQPARTTALARDAASLGGVVLAEPLQGEWVQLYGGRVWVGNPIDAFRRSDQRLYLDWVAGDPSGRAAVEHARYVLVDASSPAGRAAARDTRLRRLRAGGGDVLYRVVRRD